ncbi:GFA family protein [uncultured Roseovarius sp.]|uniref:GFA family protein n=1 Tax=uncultured Roseovarius sp. TaxID=293344 RepID=UPI002632A419|nr:GFA family protein [uncultured Roseovarius sp.]
MEKLSGSCRCGALSYSGETEIKRIINCHCTDCQQITGSIHGTLVFVDEDDIALRGVPKRYVHVAESGSRLTKLFCDTCGSQVFAKNSSRPGILAIRAGSLEQRHLIQPAMNIFCDSAVPSTPLDPDVVAFPRQPS